MSTLVIKKTRIVYIVLTLVSILFDIIYERFSYGEYSNYMRFMFLVPLLGVLPYLICINKEEKISRISYNLWNSTVAIFMSYFLVKSIINISGRYFDYDFCYILLGVIFAVMSVVSQVMHLKNVYQNG